MKTHWTTTQLIAAGALGVLTIILTLPGFLISYVSQIPGSSIPFSGLVASMMTVVILFLFKKFGAATIAMFIYGVLSLPLPIGPPGFLPKVLIFIITGLLLDSLYLIFKKESKINAIILGGASMVFSGLAWIAMYIIFLPQLANVYIPILYIVFPLGATIGAFGGLIGRFIYVKISQTAVVRRIQTG